MSFWHTNSQSVSIKLWTMKSMGHLSSNQLSSARFVSIRHPARLSVHLSAWSLACLSICMPIYLSVYLVCLSVSVSLFISVFVFLECEMYGAQLCPILFLFSWSALFHDTLNLILPTAWLSLSRSLSLSLYFSLFSFSSINLQILCVGKACRYSINVMVRRLVWLAWNGSLMVAYT